MCAVTIMSPLFVYKSDMFDFCTEELWISIMFRGRIQLSLVCSWEFLLLWGEKTPSCFIWYRANKAGDLQSSGNLDTAHRINRDFCLMNKNRSLDEIRSYLQISPHSICIYSKIRSYCLKITKGRNTLLSRLKGQGNGYFLHAFLSAWSIWFYVVNIWLMLEEGMKEGRKSINTAVFWKIHFICFAPFSFIFWEWSTSMVNAVGCILENR